MLGRSGGSIFEMTAAGRPAILVPYPHATADHQSANAAWMAEAGAATVVRDEELSAERLAAEVGGVFEDEARLAAMAAASASLAKPDAARRIADEVLKAAADELPLCLSPVISGKGTAEPVMSGDWGSRRLHFIGIGGAGMSGLALVCARLGATVTGSDRADSSYMERLRDAGLDPVVGHDAANLPDGAEVVVSTAIAADNPELALARERGIEPIHRGALLAELCAEKRLIAVAGTHGKTTTTAMIVWALRALGADPAFFVGGEVPGLGADGAAANAGWGEGEWVVAEADESDASFLELRPEVAVVTNVEMDHHARWGSLAELHAAFREFLAPARASRPRPTAASTICAEGKRDGSASTPTRPARPSCRSPSPAATTSSTPAPPWPRSSSPGQHRPDLGDIDADMGVGVAKRRPLRSPTSPGVRRRLELKGDAGRRPHI